MSETGGSVSEQLAIGDKVRELRQKRRYTLHDLSAKTGLGVDLLAQVEGGDVTPPVATLVKLARALDVDVAHFFQQGEPEEKIALTRASERRALAGRAGAV